MSDRSPTETPTSPRPRRVRCYECARRQDAAADACTVCGASFCGICPCGAAHSLYDAACDGCGARLVPKRLPRGRHPAVRAARWSLVLVLLGGAGASFVVHRSDTPAWELKDRGWNAYRAGRFEEAARFFAAATQAAPKDAQAWFNLAASYRNLGMSPEAWLPPAQRAADLDPGFCEAQVFLAVAARDAGRLDEALSRARTAAALADAPPLAERLVAEMELRRPGGDVAAAAAAARRALRRDPTAVESRILLAESLLRMYGPLPAASYPPDVASVFEQAREAAEALAGGEPSAAKSLSRAQLQLCAGAAADAYATAMDALEVAQQPGPRAATPEIAAALLLVRARALLAWRDDRDGVRADLVAALEIVPDRATAAAVAYPLAAAGRADLAEAALADVAARKDPKGSLTAVLGELLVRRGAWDEALRAALRAESLDPADPGARLVRGDALRGRGEREKARAAYEEAGKLAPGSPVPALRTALLALEEPPGQSRVAAAKLALGTLPPPPRAEPASSELESARAQLALAAGDPAAAVAAATRAAESSPGAPDLWVLLAEARLAEGAPESATRAAVAFQRARRLRPDDEGLARSECEALVRAGDVAGAAAAATRFLDRHRGSRAMLSLRARASALLGQWRVAAGDLATLVAASPGDPDLALAAADAHVRAGMTDDALRILDGIEPRGRRDLADSIALLRVQAQGGSQSAAIARLKEGGAGIVLARVLLLAGRAEEAAAMARELLGRNAGDPDATEVLIHALLDGRPGDTAARAEAAAALAALDPAAPRWLGPVLRARLFLADSRPEDAWQTIRPHLDDIATRAVPAFVAGVAAMESGHADEGVEWLRRSVVLPGAPAGVARAAADTFARAAAAAKDPARAESWARAAADLDPSHPGAALLLSRILLARGDAAMAADRAERALRSGRAGADEDFALRLAAASAQIGAGRPGLALEHVELAAKARPESGALRFVRGQARLAEGKADLAEQEFQAAAAALGPTPVVEWGLAATALLRGKPAEAADRAQRWQEAHPEDSTVSRAVARLLAERGETDAALGVLAAARRARPADAAVVSQQLEILLRARRPADAAAAARSFAAERGDEDPLALLLAASALDQSPAGADEALGLARRARSAPSLPPRGVPLAWAVEARALRTLGRRDEALAAARQGLAAAEAPLPVEVERNLQRVVGLCAFDRRETAAAVEAFRRVADLAPRDPDALNDLAWALAHEPATAAEALRIAARATDARPGDPNLWSTRAVAASAAADAKDAERSFRACLTLHEAAPATDPDARARAALRFVKFLSAAGRGEEAVAIARGVAAWKPAPSAALAAEARSVAESP